MKKFEFWVTARTPIEKQSKQDWNTPIHFKKMVHIWKFLSSIGFLSWVLTYFLSPIVGYISMYT